MTDPPQTAAVPPGEVAIAPRAGLAPIMILFLKLGTLAFGGPAAHIAIMEDEVVHHRRWLTRQQFLDLLGVASLIPGPSSTELAIYIGYRLAGVAGLLIAGICFILPAAVIVLLLAQAYVRWGTNLRIVHVLATLYPVVIAVILQALWRLGRTAVKNSELAVIGVVCAVLAFVVSPLAVLVAGGAMGTLIHSLRRDRTRWEFNPGLALAPLAVSPSPAVAGTVGILPLFLVFLKFGAVVFGSGYVLLPFLRADLVIQRHWLTERQLLDAVLIGQATPGPVFTTATFIGYLLAGERGAAAATVGIFMPAFVLVFLSGPIVSHVRRSPIAGSFLDGLNVASVALMAAVIFQLGRIALDHHFLPWTIAVVSGLILLFTRINAMWLIASGVVVGLLAGH